MSRRNNSAAAQGAAVILPPDKNVVRKTRQMPQKESQRRPPDMKIRKPEMAIRSTVFICVNPVYLWLKKFGLTGLCKVFKSKREARSISDHRAAGAQPGARGGACAPRFYSRARWETLVEALGVIPRSAAMPSVSFSMRNPMRETVRG